MATLSSSAASSGPALVRGATDWGSEAMKRRIARRYRAERNFRWAGLAALSLAAAFLALLLFTHLASRAEYRTMPARLRMNVIGSPGIDKADFELFSLAVSAINGCGMCIDSHDKVLAGHGMSAEKIQTSVRIASVVHAVARTLQAM